MPKFENLCTKNLCVYSFNVVLLLRLVDSSYFWILGRFFEQLSTFLPLNFSKENMPMRMFLYCCRVSFEPYFVPQLYCSRVILRTRLFDALKQLYDICSRQHCSGNHKHQIWLTWYSHLYRQRFIDMNISYGSEHTKINFFGTCNYSPSALIEISEHTPTTNFVNNLLKIYFSWCPQIHLKWKFKAGFRLPLRSFIACQYSFWSHPNEPYLCNVCLY